MVGVASVGGGGGGGGGGGAPGGLAAMIIESTVRLRSTTPHTQKSSTRLTFRSVYLGYFNSLVCKDSTLLANVPCKSNEPVLAVKPP